MKRDERNPDEISPLVREMGAGMDAFVAAMDAGEPIEKFTVRTTRLNLEPRSYGPDELKEVRRKLGASQPLLAKFLGISVKTLRGWEQGTRPVPTIAARYLDDVQEFPELWTRRIQTVTK